jgi:predicted nucleic acid-binding protein
VIVKQKTARFVLDAFPLIVLFAQQKGWEAVKVRLDEVDQAGDYCIMSSVNLGEVYYSIIRDRGKDVADQVIDYLVNSQIEIVFPTLHDTLQAAEFKARGGMSYADCYAAALAADRGIPVMTGDPEFRAVEREGIAIEWLPPNR